jgi:hypothetical protein
MAHAAGGTIAWLVLLGLVLVLIMLLLLLS